MAAVTEHKKLPETVLAYFEDTFMFVKEATVLDIVTLEAGALGVITDLTIFYPGTFLSTNFLIAKGGGGQPCDTGKITGLQNNAVFTVTKTSGHEGIVTHAGSYSSDARLTVGEHVRMELDSEKRTLNAKLHTGGKKHSLQCHQDCLS